MHVNLDGTGAMKHGARYSPRGRPLVNFASEAALAVLIGVRYLPENRVDWPTDLVLGWTEVSAESERIPDLPDEETIRSWVSSWLVSGRSLLVSMPSRVLPESRIMMMNPRHPDAQAVAPLTTRSFDFRDCLHCPPMLETYRKKP